MLLLSTQQHQTSFFTHQAATFFVELDKKRWVAAHAKEAPAGARLSAPRP
jgi:hypothetical protein